MGKSACEITENRVAMVYGSSLNVKVRLRIIRVILLLTPGTFIASGYITESLYDTVNPIPETQRNQLCFSHSAGQDPSKPVRMAFKEVSTNTTDPKFYGGQESI
ncbi:hypothetical protein J6590_032960 [Homalodisca vitripennis]|nr:hypothetical protein J6590_032960 [Homalodisca vitripennis]